MSETTNHLFVEFFKEPRENKRKSLAESRPIFEDVEFVKIRIAGDPKSVLVAPANDQSSVRDPRTNERLKYKELHREHYEAFRQGVDYVGSGTPLKEAPFISDAKAKEFNALNIMTVEALADLEGDKLSRLGMNGRDYKDQATAYLRKAEGNADLVRLEAENADMRRRLEALEGGAAEQQTTQAAPQEGNGGEKTDSTPFDDWDAETIRAWMTEQGGEVNANWNLKHLRKKANELNNELASEAA